MDSHPGKYSGNRNKFINRLGSEPLSQPYNHHPFNFPTVSGLLGWHAPCTFFCGDRPPKPSNLNQGAPMKTFLIVDTHLIGGLTDEVATEILANTREEACQKFGCLGTLKFSPHTEFVDQVMPNGDLESVGFICCLSINP